MGINIIRLTPSGPNFPTDHVPPKVPFGRALSIGFNDIRLFYAAAITSAAKIWSITLVRISVSALFAKFLLITATLHEFSRVLFCLQSIYSRKKIIG